MSTLGHIHDTLGTITDIKKMSLLPRDLIGSCPAPFGAFGELETLASANAVTTNRQTGEVLNFRARKREIRAFLRALTNIQNEIEYGKL